MCENLITATQSRISSEDWGGGGVVHVCVLERESHREREREAEGEGEGESRKERIEMEGVRQRLCMQKCARVHGHSRLYINVCANACV